MSDWPATCQKRQLTDRGRVILGIGGTITKVAAPALLQEIAHPRLRSVLACLYYGTYYVGSTTSAWLCVAGLYIDGDWDWRFPCMFQIFGPLVVLSITCTAPESPRWLFKAGKGDQAREVIAKYHANGDVNDPLVQWECQEIVASLAEADTQHQSSYMDFFRTKGNRKRLMTLVAMGAGANAVGNGLVG